MRSLRAARTSRGMFMGSSSGSRRPWHAPARGWLAAGGREELGKGERMGMDGGDGAAAMAIAIAGRG